MQKIRLFCLPYGGGTAMNYCKWQKHLHHSIELVPLELAGRGKYFNLPFYENMEEAIHDLSGFVLDNLNGSGYALFGHSMGSLMAYEIACRMKELKEREPVHLFVSGRYPLHIKKEEPVMHTLSDEELKNAISKIDGTPREFLEHKEMLELFLPVIRADYRLIETYDAVKARYRLECGITAMYGNMDTGLSPEDMSEWSQYTVSGFRSMEFEGDHFFINEKYEEVVKVINAVLQAEQGCA